MPSLSAVDLNLLIALDALLTEMSVSRAAERVGLSQPAMSHALGRLRDTFGDRLLVRSGRQMVPTPRAEALREPLREALNQVAALFDEPQDFDPAALERVFRVVTDDYLQLTLMPALLEAVRRDAPGVDVYVRASGGPRGVQDALSDPRTDLVVVPGEPELFPEYLFAQRLLEDPFVCVVARAHPGLDAGGALSLESYLRWPHLLVSMRGDAHGVVDEALAAQGHGARRVAVVVPNFLTAPSIVASTDLILTMPRSVARYFASWHEVTLTTPPIELPVGHYYQVWHERTHASPAHQWFRGVLSSIAEPISE